jgi:selenocysteine lyase/cysteine desulfurase
VRGGSVGGSRVTFDVHALRARFPALARQVDGRPAVFLDGPGGTQVPQVVIDAVTDYYRTSNANDGGAFITSEAMVALMRAAHEAAADLVGAASPDEAKFGANMTTLTMHISRSIAAWLRPGDEIVITTLDHEANISPWRAVAADRGLLLRQVDIHDTDATLDLADLEAKLGRRTRLVAVGWARTPWALSTPWRRSSGEPMPWARGPTWTRSTSRRTACSTSRPSTPTSL